jgi:PAS domain S-box-containing protein
VTSTKNPQDTLEPLKSSTDSMAVNSRQELRQHADQRARMLASIDSQELSLDEARHLIDEFSEYRIDLEMENEKLRRTQVALEASSAWYFRLYELAPLAYFTLTEQDVVLAANQRAQTLLGVSPNTLVDRPLTEFVSPEDLEIYARARQRLFDAAESQATDLRMVRQDGSRFWARMAMTRIEGEGARIRGVTISEITARKEAEEGLKLFRALLDQANDAIEVIDPVTARFLDVNEKACSSLGYSRQELLTLTVHDIDPIASMPTYTRYMARLRENATSTLTLESVHRRKDGSTFPVEINIRLIQLGREYVLAITRDVTERKQADEGRRKLVKQLVQSRTKLRALVAEISKAEERERRRLAAELHDGLAQTLTLIRMCLSRARNMASADQVRRVLKEAEPYVDISIDYTRSLMTQLSPRVLYDFGVPAALAWLGDQMRRYDLTVEVAGEPDDFELDEDHAVLVFQCARELLWNVIKHAQTDRAKIFYRLGDGELTLQVTDEGKGFDSEGLAERSAAAERFGLFSIGERLELHGGRLDVHSMPGQGTRAILSVPVNPTRKSSMHPPPQAVVENAAGEVKVLRIALVDDHPLLREGLRRVMAVHEDLRVVGEAQDGLSAIEMARQIKPDVIIMDINMPRMNGIQATKRILEELPDTVVVGLSVASDAYIEQGMKKAGASRCVAKARAGEEVYAAIIKSVKERRRDSVE